jgi:hypothetical protein
VGSNPIFLPEISPALAGLFLFRTEFLEIPIYKYQKANLPRQHAGKFQNPNE